MQSKNLVQVALLSGLVMAAFASPAYADPAQCQTAQFSDSVTARFPRIREVCQDVINKDGQDYAVVKGYLVRVGNQNKVARIRPILPDGTRAAAMDIEIHPDRKVLVDGVPVLPRDASVGKQLTFYVKVNEPVASLEVADGSLATGAISEPATDTTTPDMPKTASPLPLVGLAGLALLALGGGLSRLRRHKA